MDGCTANPVTEGTYGTPSGVLSIIKIAGVVWCGWVRRGLRAESRHLSTKNPLSKQTSQLQEFVGLFI